MRINPDGTTEHLGRVAEDVHPMLDDLLRLRARKQLRDRFGDVDQAQKRRRRDGTAGPKSSS